MKRKMRWYDHITINIYWLGINVASGTITPVLLPYLVALFAPAALKNTYLANIRVVGLAVAMAVQPMAGMFSDRSTNPMGRRRPAIFLGSVVVVAAIDPPTQQFSEPLGATPQRQRWPHGRHA